MSLIIVIWLFCRIRKSILSKQKHQLSSHFHSQSFTMHSTLPITKCSVYSLNCEWSIEKNSDQFCVRISKSR